MPAPKRIEVCGNLKILSNAVQRCEQNELYDRTAAKCIIKLDQAIRSSGLNLEKLLGTDGVDQEKYLQDNKVNLVKAKANLGRLIRISDAAIDDMNRYLMHFSQPDHISSEVDADRHPCFLKTKNILIGARSVFETRSNSLRDMFKLASSLEVQTKTSSKSLKSLTAPQELKDSGEIENKTPIAPAYRGSGISEKSPPQSGRK